MRGRRRTGRRRTSRSGMLQTDPVTSEVTVITRPTAHRPLTYTHPADVICEAEHRVATQHGTLQRAHWQCVCVPTYDACSRRAVQACNACEINTLTKKVARWSTFASQLTRKNIVVKFLCLFSLYLFIFHNGIPFRRNDRRTV